MKLFILFILLISILFNEINGNEYVNFIPYSNDECIGDEIGIGYSSLLSKCLPSIDSHQNYLFTLKPKNVIEWKVFKYSNKNNNNNNNNNNHNDNCNLNKTIILQPSFTSKIGSCISSEYINLDSKISLNSPIYYKISITKNSPYISAKSIVNSFTLDKKCSSFYNNNNNKNNSSNNNNVLLIQYFTNHFNVNYKSNNKISYHCINNKPFIKNQFELIEPINQECTQFKNGADSILNLFKNEFVGASGSGSSSGSGSGSSGGETTGNTGEATGNSGESSISSSTGGYTSATGDSTGNSDFSSSTTDVTTATSATTGGATSGGNDEGTGAMNFINYKPNSFSTYKKFYKKTYCSK
ncbi:hypothetical protein ACTFIV_004117 [Dictyostelium citrinum]